MISNKQQGWGQVQLTKYSSTPSTPNIYQVQVLVKYSFFLKVLKVIEKCTNFCFGTEKLPPKF